MFTTLIVQPIFNVLVTIYALLPGHNFGVAIILFTILVRTLMWPLVKKQLHHAKAMRDLQPELKRIKKATKGNRQKESQMVMELYKEREINPFSSIGLVLLQLPIFIGLFSAFNRIVNDPSTLISFSYPFVRNLSWMQQLATDISQFDNTLLGFIDLSKPAIGPGGAVYIPALIIVVASAIAQYYQSRQLMPVDKDARKLRDILRDANSGKQADQTEMTAATSKFTTLLIPGMVLIFTIGFAAALPLYWLTMSLVAILQQRRVLGKDEVELETSVADNKDSSKAVEGEILPPKKPKTNKKSSRSKSKRRRK